METKQRIVVTLVALLLIFSGPSWAQDVDIDSLQRQAQEYANQGDAESMERTYSDILSLRPGDINALLGRATARSWGGNHLQARQDFQQILNKQPEHLGALVGLGYDFAWDGRFQESEQRFKQAIQVAPDNLDAAKGLGYNYLWSGHAEQAIATFEHILARHPDDPELLVAIGQGQLQLRHIKRAESSFNQALTVQPNRSDAEEGLRAAYAAPGLLDFEVMYGNTSSGGDSGLRLLELSSWITPDWRVWGRLDDSLSLDIPALARSNEDTEGYFLGAMHKFNNRWLGLAEIGYRELPDDEETIYKVEGVHFWDDRAAKLGVQISPHTNDFTDELIYGAYHFPIAERWSLEPTLYLSTTGADNNDEWRAVLFSDYRAQNGWKLNLGIGGGNVDSNSPGASGSTTVANALLSIPFAGRHALKLSTRYEDGPGGDFTIVMIGVSLSLPRR